MLSRRYRHGNHHLTYRTAGICPEREKYPNSGFNQSRRQEKRHKHPLTPTAHYFNIKSRQVAVQQNMDGGASESISDHNSDRVVFIAAGTPPFVGSLFSHVTWLLAESLNEGAWNIPIDLSID